MLNKLKQRFRVLNEEELIFVFVVFGSGIFTGATLTRHVMKGQIPPKNAVRIPPHLARMVVNGDILLLTQGGWPDMILRLAGPIAENTEAIVKE